MGLDANLYREVSLPEDTELKGKEWDKIKKVLDKGTTIKHESVCYWRKFNALHKYFADNFGEENDNCTNMYLEIEDIIELRDLLKELSGKIKLGKGGAVKNPEVCEEMLPTTGGFFFGSTEYDEWYAEDIKNTVKMLDKVIAEHNELVKTVKEYDITYYYKAWY